jgi:tetratricopeptide (TPR) repeat protein
MNSVNQTAQQDIEPFEDRVDALFGELELAISWQRPSILFAIYGSECVYVDASTALESRLIGLGEKVIHCQANNEKTSDITSIISGVADQGRTVFFVKNLREDGNDGIDVYKALSLSREYFIDNQIRVVFWLTENEVINLAHYAPDYWTFRHRVIEFMESPKPEQIISQALESAWQGTEECADTRDNSDIKSSMSESRVLSEDGESTSLRASMLLELGILHWRKGDYEKATESLHAALKIARINKDSWFEAKCFNAIAFVKAGLGRTDEAIEAYKQAINLAPDRIFPWSNLGILYSKLDHNDAAREAFRKALEHNPGDAACWNGLGDVYLKLGCTNDAIASYQKAIELAPSYECPWNGLGNGYTSAGNIEEAINAYNKAIELAPEFGWPYSNLALVYMHQGRYAEAVPLYQRSIGLLSGDGDKAISWNRLGNAYRRLNDCDKARAAYRRAVELDPDNAVFREDLMVIDPAPPAVVEAPMDGSWEEGGDSALAEVQAGHGRAEEQMGGSSKILIDTDPKDSHIWNELGNIYFDAGAYEEAIDAYNKAIDLTPEFGWPYSNLALVYTYQGRYAEAIPLYQRSIDLLNSEREKAITWRNLGNNYRRLNDYDNAVTAYQMADELDPNSDEKNNDQNDDRIESDPKNAHIWNELGNVYSSKGAYAEAINAYNKAMELDPEFGWAYSNLALVYTYQGKFAEAIPLYQRSIELFSSDRDKASSWNRLGNTYRRLNNHIDATAAYQRAVELDPCNVTVLTRARFSLLSNCHAEVKTCFVA